MSKLSKGERLYVVIMYIAAILCGLACLLPVLNVLARSLSSVTAVAGGKVLFWPVEFNTAGWAYIIQGTSFLTALGNSVIITLAGTALSVVVTTLMAFALSHTSLPGRKFFIYLYVAMMIFNAGTLPNYFQIKEYGLLNSSWALILPCLISPYYTFVLKISFESIPGDLEEAARIDGASFLQILVCVILPVSKAYLATIVIFTSVSFWNRYFNALLYITNQKLKPAALLLYEFIKLSSVEDGLGEVDLLTSVSPDIKNASIVMLTVLPILAVYPFMQKYFVKGAMAGSIKG